MVQLLDVVECSKVLRFQTARKSRRGFLCAFESRVTQSNPTVMHPVVFFINKTRKVQCCKKERKKRKKNRMVEAAGTDSRFVFERLPAKTKEAASPCGSTGVLYSISSTTFLVPLQTSNVAGIAVAFQGALSLEHGNKRENATVGEITRA